ncbi:hypothetical protein JG688_00013613 [Phytophthora aleatoria]|uniref:Uncharacterized protein n=1 Tax=Phytophthora aleatoria TaxID=2496075 RepID=A0A8J5ID90_9STRA|nr:hypothetical protein JG688_00013613 [Phytophthora aleatoria]
MLTQDSTSQQNVHKLLGSLRHQFSSLTWGPCRYGAIPVTEAVRDDLYWFRAILLMAELNSVPSSRFSGTQPIDYEVFMAASDFVLCAVFPAIVRSSAV